MQKTKVVAIAALFLGISLAGCTGGDNGGGGGGGGGAPEAIVSASSIAPTVGEPVDFSASGVSGSDEVTWYFGDGANATGATATHTYAMPGDYIVRLVVERGDATATNDATLTYVTVSRETNFTGADADTFPPVADLSIDRQVIQTNGSVSLNATASHAWVENPDFDPELGVTPDNVPVVADAENITSYRWDWGDGSSPTEGADAVTANHTYAAPGLYTVTLTVTDANGNTADAGASVLVLGQPPAVGGYRQKDLFVTATISGPQSFDPGFDYETAGGHVIEQVYETLFGVDRDNPDRIVPVLAAEIPTVENGGITDNGTTYTIRLRQGVEFHDGTPFDADAVKFSLDRLVLLNDPSSGAPVITAILRGADAYRANSNNTAADREAYLDLDTIEVVDPSTVRIHLERPDAAVFQRLAFYGTSIVSPTAFKACHDERTALWGVCQTSDGLPPPAEGGRTAVTRDPWADANTVGTGPFQLRRWIPGDRVILDRNENYWGDAPALKTVIVQYVDDLNTRLLMLQNGEADEIYVNPADLNRVRPTIENIARFVPADTLIVDAIFWNYDVEDDAECPKRPDGSSACQLFADPKIRETFVYAFDYDSFFEDVWQGRAKPLAGVIPRGMPGYAENLQPFTRDVERARAAFEASNYSDGFTVNMYYNTGNTVRQGASELLKQNLEAISPNIRVNVVGIQFNTLLDKTQLQQIPLWILGWSPDYIATDDYIVPFYKCGGTYPVQMNFCDEELTAKITDAEHTLDAAAQAQMWRDVNREAMEKIVLMPLDQRTQTHVERSYVQGYYYSPLHSGSPNTGDYSTISKV